MTNTVDLKAKYLKRKSLVHQTDLYFISDPIVIRITYRYFLLDITLSLDYCIAFLPVKKKNDKNNSRSFWQCDNQVSSGLSGPCQKR